MIVTKCGRPTHITDEQYRRIVEWKKLKDLAEELGLSPETADMIRQGYRYKQVPNDERANIRS